LAGAKTKGLALARQARTLGLGPRSALLVSGAVAARAAMTPLESRLLNDFQRCFPLVPRPYAVLAETLGATEEAVTRALARLRHGGAVSRVGAVFRPGAVGASTLAAMAVPPEWLPAVAALVSSCREVNHNYEREHRFNLWFVVGAPDERRLAATLARIEQAARLPVLALPLAEEYHIDLGFPLDGGGARRELRAACAPRRATLAAAELRLVVALEYGLPFLSRPYAVLAARAGLEETGVLERLAQWLTEGLIRRFGVVVRHHELGYRANAMAVWDVPDEIVPRLGRALAACDGVTLAYRRARGLPQWPYNLYCMMHGTDRERVRGRLESIAGPLGLGQFPGAVLFSRTRFKQAGARVAALAEAAHG
jgi:DNA-binding Lrp family transcriptional regulator